jgi:anti-sigma B factor antagonist
LPDNAASNGASRSITLRRHDVDGCAVLAIGGEVDLATSPDLRTAIEAALDSGAAELRLDLGGTSFMDSSGLHVLFDCHARAGERLAIVCPPGPVRRLFEMTGFADRLPLAYG